MSRHVTESDFDPRQRYALYRLCDCPTCGGKGKVAGEGRVWSKVHGRIPVETRCPDCRGEGRIRQEVASCETPEAVGVALVTCAEEGEWEGCQFGLLDRQERRWLVLPWPSTARTVSAAGSLLARSKRTS